MTPQAQFAANNLIITELIRDTFFFAQIRRSVSRSRRNALGESVCKGHRGQGRKRLRHGGSTWSEHSHYGQGEVKIFCNNVTNVFASQIGHDTFGEEMMKNFQQQNVSTDYLFITKDAFTSTASITVTRKG